MDQVAKSTQCTWRLSMNNDKLWLVLDGIEKKLKRARYWITSLDDYESDVLDALRSVQAAKEKLQKKLDNN